jgi:hypothetical protein
MVFKLSEILSGLFIRDPDPDFFTHPGSMGQKGTGSLIRIRNTGTNIFLDVSCSEGASAELAMLSTMLLWNGLEQEKTLFCSSFNILIFSFFMCLLGFIPTNIRYRSAKF